MSVFTEKLTRDRFRELYSDREPEFELIDGQPEQKAMGSKRHAHLQVLLSRILEGRRPDFCARGVTGVSPA